MTEKSPFEEAIRQIDAANSEDPNKETFEGKDYPKELLYSKRMSEWLATLNPEASEEVQLAARSQHLCRWKIPRNHYPLGREGYLTWRRTLKKFHAEEAGKILETNGYDDDTIARIQALIRKENLKKDPESQLLEDVTCLVFLKNYFLEFSEKHEEEKLIHILQRTWKKMSERGRNAALKIEYSSANRALIKKALNP
jgi:hypothetical protein